MAKTQHRLRKHDMKEDSFVTLAFRAQEYIQTHQKPFMVGLGALIVVAVSIWLWGSASRRAEFAAEENLADAFLRVQQNDMVGAAAAYQRVIEEHGGTAGAREAQYYLGNLFFVQQDWTQAIDAYTAYLNRYEDWDPGRTAAAWAAIADAHQAQGAHSEAIEAYRKALRVENAEYLAGDFWVACARSALAMGDPEQATAFADSLFEREGNSAAMSRMRELLARGGIAYTRGF